LEPPCTKSNGARYAEKALPPDPLHGDTGWANTGGWGKPPNDSIPDIVSFLLQEQEYLPDGTHGCTTYACMYGAPTHTGDAGAPGEREPISDAVWGFFVGDDIDGCFSGSGIAEPATGCTMLGSNFIPGVGPGKWGIKGGGKLFRWLKQVFKHGDGAQALTRTVDDILMPGGKAIGKAGTNPAIREVKGGMSDATALFRELSEGGTVVAQTPTITRVEIPGGGIVQLRTAMSKSPNSVATIDVNIPSLPGIDKIKFNP
jgi:hypothetical protein